MKKLSIVWMVMFVILSAGQVFALPGVYRAGAPTMDLYVGECETRTISMDGTGWGTSPLVSGSILVSQSDNGASVDITTCTCYDGTLTPAIWDAPINPVFDPTGFPGGLFVAMHNVVEGVTPSANILLCDVTFCGVKPGETSIRIDNAPESTWVAQDMSVYDVYIDPALINATVSINYCEGDFDYDRDVDGTDAAGFKSDFGRSGLTNACPVAGPAAVQKTWQTTSYATGDDGALQKGVAWPNPRFTDNEDGTVTDKMTGLIWLKNADCFGQRSWDSAISDCNGLSSGNCGLTDGSNAGDWRLPNRNELSSLLNSDFYGPAVPNTAGTGQCADGDPFNNLLSGDLYWSSSTFPLSTNQAYYVDTFGSIVYVRIKSESNLVWPVRGGH
jgi:hypothetical protein